MFLPSIASFIPPSALFLIPLFFPPLTLFTRRSSSPLPLLFSIFHSVGPPDSPQTLRPSPALSLSVSASRSSFFITRAGLSTLTDIDQDAAAGMLSCCKFVQRGLVEERTQKTNKTTRRRPNRALNTALSKDNHLSEIDSCSALARRYLPASKSPSPSLLPFSPLAPDSPLPLQSPPSFSLSKMALPQMFNSSYLLIKRSSKLSIDVKASI